VPNVVVITTSAGTEWLGNIVAFNQYRTLLEWALRCGDAGEMLALPCEFHECKISPFCRKGFRNPLGDCRRSFPYAAFHTRECPEREENTATNSAVSSAIKASLASGIGIGGAKQRPDGINL
jgi:hypothetical protein